MAIRVELTMPCPACGVDVPVAGDGVGARPRFRPGADSVVVQLVVHHLVLVAAHDCGDLAIDAGAAAVGVLGGW